MSDLPLPTREEYGKMIRETYEAVMEMRESLMPKKPHVCTKCGCIPCVCSPKPEDSCEG